MVIDLDTNETLPGLFELTKLFFEIVETLEAIDFKVVLAILITSTTTTLGVGYKGLQPLGQRPPMVELVHLVLDPSLLGCEGMEVFGNELHQTISECPPESLGLLCQFLTLLKDTENAPVSSAHCLTS
ncbi:hypothetical protein HYV70_03785 [Candidatus Uhrbacteria bacterium]|nr:hypothetical protein [Candidatus Uhrbacteria bacterium]